MKHLREGKGNLINQNSNHWYALDTMTHDLQKLQDFIDDNDTGMGRFDQGRWYKLGLQAYNIIDELVILLDELMDLDDDEYIMERNRGRGKTSLYERRSSLSYYDDELSSEYNRYIRLLDRWQDWLEDEQSAFLGGKWWDGTDEARDLMLALIDVLEDMIDLDDNVYLEGDVRSMY